MTNEEIESAAYSCIDTDRHELERDWEFYDYELAAFAHAIIERHSADQSKNRRHCQGCADYFPTVNPHPHGNRVCHLDAEGTCERVR